MLKICYFGAVGRARAWHARGHGLESQRVRTFLHEHFFTHFCNCANAAGNFTNKKTQNWIDTLSLISKNWRSRCFASADLWVARTNGFKDSFYMICKLLFKAAGEKGQADHNTVAVACCYNIITIFKNKFLTLFFVEFGARFMYCFHCVEYLCFKFKC